MTGNVYSLSCFSAFLENRKEQTMVKLFFEDTNLPSPVAACRWCLNKSDIQKLKELKVTKPYVLLIVARQNEDGKFREVERKFIPLEREMDWVEFRGSGKHRVFGTVVWGSSNDRKNKEIISQLRYNMYRWQFVDEDGDFHMNPEFAMYEIEHGSFDLVVPGGYFAKPPSGWEKWWVNLWFERKCENDCRFKRRRFLAYSLQPVVVLGYILYRSILTGLHILVMLLCGMRNIEYKVIWHPFIYDRWDAYPGEGKKTISYFLEDSSGKERHPAFFLMMPMAQVVLLILVSCFYFALTSLEGTFWSNVVLLLKILAISNLVILGTGFLLVKTGLRDKLLDKLNKLYESDTDEQRRMRLNKKMEKFFEQYDDIICDGSVHRPDISILPAKRRTFYMKVMNYKSKHCLPYAEN